MKNYITVSIDTGVDVSGIQPEDVATVTVGTTIILGKVFLVVRGPDPPIIPPDLTDHEHVTPAGTTGPPVMP